MGPLASKSMVGIKYLQAVLECGGILVKVYMGARPWGGRKKRRAPSGTMECAVQHELLVGGMVVVGTQPSIYARPRLSTKRPGPGGKHGEKRAERKSMKGSRCHPLGAGPIVGWAG